MSALIIPLPLSHTMLCSFLVFIMLCSLTSCIYYLVTSPFNATPKFPYLSTSPHLSTSPCSLSVQYVQLAERQLHTAFFQVNQFFVCVTLPQQFSKHLQTCSVSFLYLTFHFVVNSDFLYFPIRI